MGTQGGSVDSVWEMKEARWQFGLASSECGRAATSSEMGGQPLAAQREGGGDFSK
jgi:hypothetical protein